MQNYLTRIKTGWLRKRRENAQPQKRWVVLTDRELKYYHDPSSRSPSKVISLKQAMLKKSETKDFCFEIHSPLLLDRRNREGRLYFIAESEREMQEWFTALRVVIGTASHLQGKRDVPITYVDTDKRKKMVNRANRRGRTPLHMVACADASVNKDAIAVATWLAENGAELNAQDNEGETPAHLAVEHGNIRMAAALFKKGADLTLRNMICETVFMKVKNARDLELLNKGSNASTEQYKPSFEAPVKLPSCSYVSIMLEKLSMGVLEKLMFPFITVSVFTTKQHLVEAPQDIINPALTKTNSIWWGWCWHMQTPLENLSAGSLVLVELKDRRMNPKSNQVENMVVAWAVVHLDDSRIETKGESLEMFRAPVDLTLRKMEPADLFLQVDVSLTRAEAACEVQQD